MEIKLVLYNFEIWIEIFKEIFIEILEDVMAEMNRFSNTFWLLILKNHGMIEPNGKKHTVTNCSTEGYANSKFDEPSWIFRNEENLSLSIFIILKQWISQDTILPRLDTAWLTTWSFRK